MRVWLLGLTLGAFVACGGSSEDGGGAGSGGAGGGADGGVTGGSSGSSGTGGASGVGGSSGSAGATTGGSAGATGGSAGAVTGGSAGTGAAGSGGSAGSPGVDCNPNNVTCFANPPSCAPGEVPSVQANCWGACVPILNCDTVQDCSQCQTGYCAAYQAFTTEYRCVLPTLTCSATTCSCLAQYFCVGAFNACSPGSSGGPIVNCACPAC